MRTELLEKAPLLMPFQHEAFNGDKHVQELFLKTAKKNNCKIAFETGTALAGTTFFLSQNFEMVVTIELMEEYQNFAKKFCEGQNKINFVLGNSAKKIYEWLALVSPLNNVIFFLDAHWNEHFPLIEELEAIANIRSGQDAIVIHDCYVPNTNLGYDEYGGKPISIEMIEPALKKIYPNGYNHFYNSEELSTGAKRGVIFIEPKS